MNTETRTIQNRVEIRSGADGLRIEGLAARYNSLSNDLGGFKERISPGAFRSVINDDCRFLLNHDASQIFGRTKSGTLRIADTASGLTFSCLLPDTQAARDLHTSVARGDIDQCSFSFEVGKGDEVWDESTDDDGNRFARRTIRSFKRLHDCSVVTYPAYDDTQASARALVPEAVLIEARSFAARAGILAVPRVAYVPYVRLTDEQVANAVQEEKGIRARTCGMTETPVERFIKAEKEKRDRPKTFLEECKEYARSRRHV